MIERLYTEDSKYTTSLSGTGSERELDIQRLKQSFDNLKPFIRFTEDFKLLDVGCNNGDFLRLFSDKQINLAGIDYSINIKFVADLKEQGVDIREGTDLTVFSEKFDFISVLHVLEHVDRIHDFLNDIKYSLKYGGTAYIEVPDAERYEAYYNSPFGYYDLEHINHFTSASLKKLLARQGFEIQKEFTGDFKMNEALKYPYIGFIVKKSKIANIAKYENVFQPNRIEKSFKSYLEKSEKKLTEYSYRGNFENTVIYGVGANTLRTIGLLNTDINLIKYFVDRNKNYHISSIGNKKIYSVDFLLNDNSSPDVVIFSKLYYNQIKNNLLNKGFKGNIYSFY
ncbi:class I SAM-dependent methyltransferase [Schleiferiaceae bacterium]|nr:class I SAM-dependent methyltransferase [Schleiferiaceae bacterium]